MSFVYVMASLIGECWFPTCNPTSLAYALLAYRLRDARSDAAATPLQVASQPVVCCAGRPNALLQAAERQPRGFTGGGCLAGGGLGLYLGPVAERRREMYRCLALAAGSRPALGPRFEAPEALPFVVTALNS